MGALAAVALMGCASGDGRPDDGQGYPDARNEPLAGTPDARPDAEVLPDAAGPPPPDAFPCTGGAAAMEYGGHCYILFTTAAPDWATARQDCEALAPPAHLATITDAAENGVALALVGGREIWIGLTDSAAEDVWQWLNGEPFVFADWQPDEPNDEPNNADCVRFWERQWADEECGANHGYLCER